MNKTLLALYGLKWNPFAPGVPAEALHVSPRVDSFCRRVRHLVAEGGFAVVTGDPGTGKSACLRILADQLAGERDVKVGMISRPQANIADFYREMGDLFGVPLRPHNRWGGAKILRQSWQAHIDSALSRPVLIVDEAQEMGSPVLSELRLLTSAKLDSYILLTVVLAGDARLVDPFGLALGRGGEQFVGHDHEAAQIALGVIGQPILAERIFDIRLRQKRGFQELLIGLPISETRSQLAAVRTARGFI